MNRKVALIAVVLVLAIGIIIIRKNNQPDLPETTGAIFKNLLPPDIANLDEDFYPLSLSREEILTKRLNATEKSGYLEDEVWSGVILVTGDIEVRNLEIKPGTIVLIEANSDDQGQGDINTNDPMNPHEFLGEDYSKTHIMIRVNMRLDARGTPEKPIIFTSTADEPWLADWERLVFKEGVMEYTFLEYCYGMSIVSSDTTISHCVIRNVLGQGVMFGRWEESGIHGEKAVSPTIICNYMYNFGHMAVQSFFANPTISNNIFIQKNTDDQDLYNYLSEGENGALDIHGGNGTITNNFLSSGQSTHLGNRPKHGSSGICISEATQPIIQYNTIIDNINGVEIQGGFPIINNNNIHHNEDNNLVVRTIYSEPGRINMVFQYDEPFNLKDNWWGVTTNSAVRNKLNLALGLKIELGDIAQKEISDSHPDWDEFGWLIQ